MSKIITRSKTEILPDGRRWHVGPVVECDCRRQVKCNSSWANQCQCGTEYNGSGQQLAHRSQWGEETGESF